jgi:hypothetical protein
LHLPRDFYAAHSRHCDIKQHKIDAGLPIQQVEGGTAAAHFQHGVTKFF